MTMLLLALSLLFPTLDSAATQQREAVAQLTTALTAQGGNPKVAPAVASAVQFYAAKHGVDPHLVVGVIAVENRELVPTARNRSGATGIMQVMPHWRRDIRDCGQRLTAVATNICYGTRILAINLRGRSETAALYRYNGCRHRTRQCRAYVQAVIQRARGASHAGSPPDSTLTMVLP